MTEPLTWPTDLPRPTYDQIRATVLAMSSLPPRTHLGNPGPGGFGERRLPRRTADVVLARHLVALVCQRVRGMSTPELAKAIGVHSHATFTGRKNWARNWLHCDLGTRTYNAVIEALVRTQQEKNNVNSHRHV